MASRSLIVFVVDLRFVVSFFLNKVLASCTSLLLVIVDIKTLILNQYKQENSHLIQSTLIIFAREP